MQKPLISIIMPAYNSEAYISESIYSVLNQTWDNWELLVIDDASSDRTKDIIQAFQKSDSRIHYIANASNMGVAGSRTHGIHLSRGEWIAFLDSDDLWTPEKLSDQFAFAQQMNALFTFTGSAFIDREGHPLSHVLTVPLRISYKELLKQNIISCSSVLISKQLLLFHPMPDIANLHEDFACWLQILHDYNICAFGLNTPHLIYRITSNSKSGNKKKAALMTYRVYRHLGLPHHSAIYYWCHYFLRSINKYRKIKPTP